MSEYDGLNLPELLEKMHALVLPESVVWWPVTDGWWVLIGWLFTLSALGIVRIRQHQRHNRYRQEALRALREIEFTANPGAAGEIAAIVKRCALTVFPRRRVASLYGDAWAEFLIETGGNDPIVRKAAAQIARAAYDPEVPAATLLPGAERWIRQHRA